jgi:hypothetical protein
LELASAEFAGKWRSLWQNVESGFVAASVRIAWDCALHVPMRVKYSRSLFSAGC